MTLMTWMFRRMASKSDARRDRGLTTPDNVVRHDDIDYAVDGDVMHRLDVYLPARTTAKLPTIVSIHGGGWVYGTKEIYQFYGMSMAQRGFAFVNFNYRIAPAAKYPAPLVDTNAVCAWIVANASKYFLDPDNVILVGDSAGAQLASQYAAVYANPEYARRFPFRVPALRIRCLGLNCGVYEPLSLLAGRRGRPSGIVRDYFGRHPERFRTEIDVLGNITSAFPPCFVMTSAHDALTPNSAALVRRLEAAGIPHVHREYGKDDASCGHVFHVDVRKAEATRCNDDEAAFFRTWLHRD